MTPEQQIVKMTTAIRQAIKVMGDRFGSTETVVARAVLRSEGVDAGVTRIEFLRGNLAAARQPVAEEYGSGCWDIIAFAAKRRIRY
jgi:hypothetical protein